MKILILLPTYNESESIRKLIPLLEEYINSIKRSRNLDIDILVIDDNSPDRTYEIVREYMGKYQNIHLIVRPSKMGLGTALARGFKEALNRGYDALITMDADLQHPPEYIVDLINAYLNGCDIVIASRYIKGGGIEGWSKFRRIVSSIANIYGRGLTGLKIRDLTTGYRLYSRKVLEYLAGLNLKSSGFVFQVEVLYRLKNFNLKICEVPFIFKSRMHGKSKLSRKIILEYLINLLKLRLGLL